MACLSLKVCLDFARARIKVLFMTARKFPDGSLFGVVKEVRSMMEIFIKSAKIVALFSIFGLILVGCASQTGQPAKTFDDNFRFVPRIHVEDNSFGVSGGGDYSHCSYDTLYEGYWCAK
jgi:hypothetical protein